MNEMIMNEAAMRLANSELAAKDREIAAIREALHLREHNHAKEVMTILAENARLREALFAFHNPRSDDHREYAQIVEEALFGSPAPDPAEDDLVEEVFCDEPIDGTPWRLTGRRWVPASDPAEAMRSKYDVEAALAELLRQYKASPEWDEPKDVIEGLDVDRIVLAALKGNG